jgi:hypothetical protein
MRTLRLLMAAIVVLYGTTELALAASKAEKTLNQIKKVDGEGSGLDADTVRGQTPQSIIATANSIVSSALANFLTSAYSKVATITVATDFCNTVDVTCNAGDFLLSCGGAVSLTSGYLTEVTELINERTCRAGGCGNTGFSTGGVSSTSRSPSTCSPA